MILENLEWDEREEAQVELGQLADVLRGEGFDVDLLPLDGAAHAKLEESADVGRAALEVLNLVLAATETALAETAITALLRWAKGRRRFRDKDAGDATAVIWGPNYEILSEVRLPEPDDDEGIDR
ncbi:MAG TPA: hypothetical protein VGO13_08025 [Solirubrobacterales bacterium]|jgi:hypothetical protein|nr:hypothetical protein [Solirubrobacterales bacterium]